MPSGTGATVLATLPKVPFVIDPETFFGSTEKNVLPLPSIPFAVGSSFSEITLPKEGVLSKLELTFVGTLTVTAAGTGQTQPAPSVRWPYGLIENFQLSPGMGGSSFNLPGIDLYTVQQVDDPFVAVDGDVYPGSVGGDATALAAGSYPVVLTFRVPVAADQVSLVASLFLQSDQANVGCSFTPAPMTDLVAPGGTASLWALSGNLNVSATLWSIPVGSKGELILPDVSHVHVLSAQDLPLNGTGEQAAKLQRPSGNLQRLFWRVQNGRLSFLSPLASTSPTEIDSVKVGYGVTKTPWNYKPASVLSGKNARDYGAPLPYETLVIDTLRENPARDAIYLEGITDLQITNEVDSSVTVVSGAQVHALEEVLI